MTVYLSSVSLFLLRLVLSFVILKLLTNYEISVHQEFWYGIKILFKALYIYKALNRIFIPYIYIYIYIIIVMGGPAVSHSLGAQGNLNVALATTWPTCWQAGRILYAIIGTLEHTHIYIIYIYIYIYIYTVYIYTVYIYIYTYLFKGFKDYLRCLNSHRQVN